MSSSRDHAQSTSDGHGAPTPHADIPLPAPRLQLRWGDGVELYRDRDIYGEEFVMREWVCHYELVLPLRDADIRREIWKDGEEVGSQTELVIPVNGPTKRTAAREPCDFGDGLRKADAPYRDGAHAKWDSEILGGLPIFVIAPDGTAFRDGAERVHTGSEAQAEHRDEP